jgi:hypothetical protein
MNLSEKINKRIDELNNSGFLDSKLRSKELSSIILDIEELEKQNAKMLNLLIEAKRTITIYNLLGSLIGQSCRVDIEDFIKDIGNKI